MTVGFWRRGKGEEINGKIFLGRGERFNRVHLETVKKRKRGAEFVQVAERGGGVVTDIVTTFKVYMCAIMLMIGKKFN